MQRRTLMAASAAALAFPALAQPQSKTPLSNAALAPNPAEFRKAMADFTQGRKPLAEGLHLDVPTLADNPAAVPVKVKVTLPITQQDWCEEIIVLADLNPRRWPAACNSPRRRARPRPPCVCACRSRRRCTRWRA